MRLGGTENRYLFFSFDLSALGGTRTPNLLIRSQMLYPLSYKRRVDADYSWLEIVLLRGALPKP